MSKLTPKLNVDDIRFVDSIKEFSKQERKEYGIVTSTGIINAYRVAFALGQGASRKDDTWSHSQNIHTCCSSKVSWRHKVNCQLLTFKDEDL